MSALRDRFRRGDLSGRFPRHAGKPASQSAGFLMTTGSPANVNEGPDDILASFVSRRVSHDESMGLDAGLNGEPTHD